MSSKYLVCVLCFELLNPLNCLSLQCVYLQRVYHIYYPVCRSWNC